MFCNPPPLNTPVRTMSHRHQRQQHPSQPQQRHPAGRRLQDPPTAAAILSLSWRPPAAATLTPPPSPNAGPVTCPASPGFPQSSCRWRRCPDGGGAGRGGAGLGVGVAGTAVRLKLWGGRRLEFSHRSGCGGKAEPANHEAGEHRPYSSRRRRPDSVGTGQDSASLVLPCPAMAATSPRPASWSPIQQSPIQRFGSHMIVAAVASVSGPAGVAPLRVAGSVAAAATAAGVTTGEPGSPSAAPASAPSGGASRGSGNASPRP